MTSLVSQLSLYAVLLVALRDVGVSDAEVGWAEVLAVFAFARLATAIPLTPGGVGLVEAVLITTLSAAGGDRDQVVAGVLVLPGPDLGLTDPGRGRLLPVVAAELDPASTAHGRRPARKCPATVMASGDRPDMQTRTGRPPARVHAAIRRHTAAGVGHVDPAIWSLGW